MQYFRIVIALIIYIFLIKTISEAKIGTISGIVLDAQSKEPVKDVIVELSDGFKETPVGYAGRFCFYDLLEDSYTLKFWGRYHKFLQIENVSINPDTNYKQFWQDTFYLEEDDSPVIEVEAKPEILVRGYMPSLTMLNILVLNEADSTALPGINLTLTDGKRGVTNDTGVCWVFPDKEKVTSVKFSKDGYKLLSELDYTKQTDTFYIPYPMLIEDTLFSFSGYALFKKDSLPVNNAIMRLDGIQWGVGYWQTTTDSAGYFIFGGLPPAKYQLKWSFKTSVIQWDQGHIENVTIDSTNVLDTFYLNEIRGK